MARRAAHPQMRVGRGQTIQLEGVAFIGPQRRKIHRDGKRVPIQGNGNALGRIVGIRAGVRFRPRYVLRTAVLRAGGTRVETTSQSAQLSYQEASQGVHR